MITNKEKIVVQIIYNEYIKNKNSGKLYMKTDELISKSGGNLFLPDLHALILHGHSQYIGFHGAGDSLVRINPAGISYMEDKPSRVVKEIAFWIFGLGSLAAAIYSVFDYYHK